MSKLIAASVLALSIAAAPTWAQAPERSPLVPPTQWGADDQAGASNTQTPEKALQAAALITEGVTYPLARTIEPGIPLLNNRVLVVRGTAGIAAGPLGSNGFFWNDDFISGELGQVGAQLDGLGHSGVYGPDGPIYYGGRTAAEVNAANGLASLGIEHVKPFFTRGILVDMEAYKGVMDVGQEITIADLEGALAAQGIDPDSITPGDVVLVHTGWGRLWGVDNARYTSGGPGLGFEAAVWLADKGVAILGSDVSGVEVQPGPDPDIIAPVHQEMLARRGVFLLESAATERLADAGVTEFAFAFTPVPIRGATGAPGAALAIR
jgi:kynurenine formamidase